MARVDVARRHDPIERRTNNLVALEIFVFAQGRLGLQHRGMLVVVILLGDDAVAQQDGIALVGDQRKLIIGAVVGDLLIGFRRLDFREHLAGADAVAFVDVDRLQIAGDLGVNLGFIKAAHGGRQPEVAGRRHARYLGYQHVRTRCGLLRQVRGLAADPALTRQHESGRRGHQ